MPIFFSTLFYNTYDAALILNDYACCLFGGVLVENLIQYLTKWFESDHGFTKLFVLKKYCSREIKTYLI